MTRQRTVKLTMSATDFRLICVALQTQADKSRATKSGDPLFIEQFRKELFAQAFPMLSKFVAEPLIPTEL